MRLVCARENQKSLSRDFIFPNARVSGATVPTVFWGNMGPLGMWEAANQWSRDCDYLCKLAPTPGGDAHLILGCCAPHVSKTPSPSCRSERPFASCCS